MITHPDNMIDFAIYRVLLKNNDKFTAQFIKFSRVNKVLHLMFDSIKDHRGWCIDWASIKRIVLVDLPLNYDPDEPF